MSTITSFFDVLELSISNQGLIKLSLGNYHGLEQDLKQIVVKLVLIKRELKLSFVYSYKTKDITKNYTSQEGIGIIKDILQFKGFRSAHLQTNQEILDLQFSKKAELSIKVKNQPNSQKLDFSHDKEKERKIRDTNRSYLHQLNLTDENGKVYKNAQDKWKQINHYIEILNSSLQSIPAKDNLNIVDMGAGKGYLTFALYDYLKNELKRNIEVIGVEYRNDLVEYCNQVAEKANFEHLKFVEGTIEDFQSSKPIDVLIALHACDTATDDAIFKGIKDESSLIVVAPCCHKQVRRELEKNKKKNDLNFMVKYGIFLERHAEMLTDSIRSLILEYHGYETKVIQFISDQHTPKNVMILASKKGINVDKQKQIKAELDEIKSYFGIGYHHLEKLCGI